MKMRNSNSRNIVVSMLFGVSIFFHSFVQADTCGFNPGAYLDSYKVNGNSQIGLVSSSPNPIDSLSNVTLQISNAQVPVTETWVQPGYYYEALACDAAGCFTYCAWRSQYSYQVKTKSYPNGTATIRQNGVTLGTVAVNGSSATYTAPPPQAAGSFDYVAVFTPNSTKFTSATSNALTVVANLNPGILMSIITAVLSE